MVIAHQSYHPSKFQRVLLTLIGLSPLCSIALGLFYFSSIWLTTVCMHATMIILPILYKLCFNSSTFEYTRGELKNAFHQGLIGLIFCSIIVIGLMAPGTLLIYFFKSFALFITGFSELTCNDFAIDCNNFLNPLMFAYYFTVVNPGVEEWFWRVFLVKSFPESWKWFVALLYSEYHFFIILRFTGIIQAIFGFSFIVGVGISLQLIKERYGLLSAVSAHMGFDLCAMIAWGLLLN
ncbi:unnamed protein product [Blepharisma stoltei]|uniref:CAAX prenyl protease 2/Lysostaphin resistance protein A-like domain-containing protein n=1 Tax=Blepharisma stoltei TaxID=1481888 RepID=A0AAU9JQ40_9CILI|nr:unnamed protein product [Blepharisma stoltei]